MLNPELTKNLRQILVLFLLCKGVVWGSMVFSFYTLTYHQENHFGNKYYPYSQKISLKHIFQTWDTNHYLYLAEKGYSTPSLRESMAQEIDRHQRLLYYRKAEFLKSQERLSPEEQLQTFPYWREYEQKQQFLIYQLQKAERDTLNSDAFPPAYPFLIKGVMKVTSCSSLISALLLANLFSLGVVLLFFLLVAETSGIAVARLAVLSWMTTPYAFVFHIPYTESLFLAVTLLGFYSVHKQRFWLSAACFGVLPLIRVLGILIVLPYAYLLWKWKRSFVYLLFPIIGFGLYLGTMFYLSGDAGIGFKAQEGFISKHSGFRLFQLGEWFRFTFWDWKWEHWFHPQLGAMDRLLFLFFVFWLVRWGWKLERVWFFYILAYGLFPALTSLGLMSYSRYLISAFPLFLWIGTILEKYPKLQTPFFVLGIVGQMALASRMGLNYWVC